MRSRPILPLTIVATFLVVWLWVRMWWGSVPDVWRLSCLLGAWAPLGAATIYLYIRAVGDEEHSVMGAWLVRAVGMHCVLVWMLGASDWLRGAPGHPSGWDPDLGAPVVLFSFFPVFALSVGAIRWMLSVARRLHEPSLRPAMPAESAHAVPFRGVRMVDAGTPLARVPIAPMLVGAVSCAVACGADEPAYWVLGASALPLAAATVRNHRALAPSVVGFVATSAAVLLHESGAGLRAMALVVVWPWLALAATAFYLGAVEALLRTRRVLAR